MPKPRGKDFVEKQEAVSVRLTPKTRWALELMERVYESRATATINRALDELFSTEHIGLLLNVRGEEYPKRLDHLTWSDEECVRFAKVAMYFPDCLNRLERKAWDGIARTEKYWMRPLPPSGTMATESPSAALQHLNESELRNDWPVIKRELQSRLEAPSTALDALRNEGAAPFEAR